MRQPKWRRVFPDEGFEHGRAESSLGVVVLGDDQPSTGIAHGVDLSDVFGVLENDGVATFAASWRQLLDAYPTSAGTAENVHGRGEPDR